MQSFQISKVSALLHLSTAATQAIIPSETASPSLKASTKTLNAATSANSIFTALVSTQNAPSSQTWLARSASATVMVGRREVTNEKSFSND